MKPGVALLALTFKRHAATIAFIFGWSGLLVAFAPMVKGLPAPIVLVLSMPAVGQWLVLLAQISYPQSDLTAAGSGYPEFLLRLPMSTRGLALWPVLATLAGSLVLWLCLAYGFWARVGIPAPVGFIGGMTAAVVGAVFLISWRPFSNGSFRLISLGVALLGLVGLGIWLRPPAVAFFGLAVMTVGLSVHSVRLARFSVGLSSGLARSVGSRFVRPFASPGEALFWMEWRLRGRAFPFTVAAFAVVLSIPLAFMGGVPAELAGHGTVNGWIPLGLPVLVFGTVGIGMLLRPDATLTRQDRTAFFMTLPVSNSEILRSKLREQSMGVLLAVGVVLAVLVGWLLLPPAPLFSFLRSPVLALEGLLLIGVLWRSRTVWTLAACSPDETRSRMIGMGAMMMPILTMLPVGIALDSGFSLVRLLPLVPWVLSVFLVLRVWFAYRVCRGLATLSAVEAECCRGLVAAWGLGAVVLWGLLVWVFWLQPAGFRALVGHPVLVTLLAAFAAAPLVRPLLARQFLFAARHG